MSNDLKPCPFCGGEAELKCNTEMGGTQYQVKCKQCPTTVGRFWFWKSEDAIEAWNARKPIDKTIEQLKEMAERICSSTNCKEECEVCDFYSEMEAVIKIVRDGGIDDV